MKNVKNYNFPNGITIKEFKKIIKDWPEHDENGELCEVWMMVKGISFQVTEIMPLNKRKYGILLESEAFKG